MPINEMLYSFLSLSIYFTIMDFLWTDRDLIVVIDQHAAHERIQLEKLTNGRSS